MICSGLKRTRSIIHYIKVSSISSQISLLNKSDFIEKPEDSEQKKKKKALPKITLISQDDNISITTLEEAQKLSKRRELKLVNIVDYDMKTQRPVYKLMTSSEYLSEELKQREQRKLEKTNSNAIKGDKVLKISSNIAEHDLKVQFNKVLKWINKNYEVRVVINGTSTNMEKAENVHKFLETQIGKDGRIVQKRTKGNDLKFQVVPPKKNKEDLQNS